MSNNIFSENRAVHEIMWKTLYSQTGHRHTLRMRNTYYPSTTTVVAQTRLYFTFIPTLPVLLYSVDGGQK
jgi:hypothetical protein